MTEMRRIASVCLSVQISDPDNRYIMPMSTMHTIDAKEPNIAWLAEAAWDGITLGDIQVYRNKNVTHDDKPMKDEQGNNLEPEWVWWQGIPRGKYNSYKLAADEAATLTPSTVGIIFDPNAQRKEEPRQVAKGSGQARA